MQGTYVYKYIDISLKYPIKQKTEVLTQALIKNVNRNRTKDIVKSMITRFNHEL